MISYFRVKGQSMEPLCKEGDFVLLDKLSYLAFRPRAGDTVVLKHPEQNRLLLKYIMKERLAYNILLYWVEGLNKTESSDSRNFGWVPREMILGRAVVVKKKEQKIPPFLMSRRDFV
jgi:nickel-type superoxide dismutase maturation protease